MKSTPALRRRRHIVATAVLATATTVLTAACGAAVDGQALSPLYDPLRVGGMQAVDGPSGVRDTAPDPTGRVKNPDNTIQNTDNEGVDRLALLAVNDVTEYWEDTYYQSLDGMFRPITELVSYDSDDPTSRDVCGQQTYDFPNAFFCRDKWLMAWDRASMIPITKKFFGDTTVAGLIAHEYGHALQRMADLVGLFTEGIVFEQQADCFAGNYLRWVAEGNSSRFTLSTGDGLNRVLAGLITIRDPIITPRSEELIEEGHGTALDRVSAFQIGFIEGPRACAAIDMDEIEQRRGDLPMALQVDDTGQLQSGQLPIDRATISILVDQLGHIFPLTNKPTLTFDDADATCAGRTVDYCSDTNTINVNLAELQKMGEPKDESDYVLVQGDNTALSLVMSRYTLAVQHEQGVPLNTSQTALRAACLTGVAHSHMLQPETPEKGGLILTAGDVDEAVAGLLTNGEAATDEAGTTVPAGFTRIVAFRSGLAGDQDLCFQRFSSNNTGD